MNASHDFAAIASLDLEPIKKKLMHRQSGEGWSHAKADAVEREYRRFLYLMKAFPESQSAPLWDVDTFWHYHILDTVKYMADCDAVFGHYLHHNPNAGLEGAEDDEQAHEAAGERMRQVYDQAFGEGAFAHAAQELGAQAAWCLVPPSADAAGAGDSCSGTDGAWCVARFTAAGTKADGKLFLPASAAVAWCLVPPSVKAGTLTDVALTAPQARTAWCLVPPSVKASAQPARAAVAAKTAWCLVPPSVTSSAPRTAAAAPKPATGTAWCLVPPSAPRQAAAQAALA